MGRKATCSVETRNDSFRVKFTWKGQRYAEPVVVDGTKLPLTAANKKFAERLAKDIAKAIENGSFDYGEFFPGSKHAEAPPEERTFGQLADLWHKSKGKLAHASKDQYATAVRFWKRMFGTDTPLSKIDHQLAEAEIGDYEWSSAKQHNNYMIALRGIFGMEYRGSKAALSPVAEVKNMTVIKRMPDPLSRAERDMVLADMKQRYDVRVYAYYLFMFFTGMRPEESIALRWSDIDFNRKTARIQRVRTFKGSERDGSKTHAEREVDLVSQALEALKLMAPYTKMLSVEREDDEDTAADIFQNPVTRRPWHDERSQRDHYWKPCLKRLGIRARRSYCTRHTYCTVALMGRVNPAYIALQAGHSVKMLLEKYARWIPGADDGAERRMLESAMSAAKSSQNCPSGTETDSKPLISQEEVGRRDWTRTKKTGGKGV